MVIICSPELRKVGVISTNTSIRIAAFDKMKKPEVALFWKVMVENSWISNDREKRKIFRSEEFWLKS